MKSHFPYFLVYIIASISSIHVSAQHVQNPAFEKRINQLIRFEVPVITVERAKYDTTINYIFLDAREKDEYEVSHIPGSRNVGYDDFKLENILDIPKDSPIVIYCSIGYRSEKIGEKLKNAGYTNIHNLFGSIFEWANRGFLIVDRHGKKTSSLHTYNKRWSKWIDNPEIRKVW